MDRWLNSIGDNPNRSERAVINTLWDGEISKPETAAPEVAIIDGMISLSSETDGASISYKIIRNNYEPAAWELYSEPFKVAAGATLQIQAHRIGYHESKITRHPIP